jgi:hypothetical protein
MFDSDYLRPYWAYLIQLNELLKALYFQSVQASRNFGQALIYCAGQQWQRQISAPAADTLPATYLDTISTLPAICTSFIECVIERQHYISANFPIESTYINNSGLSYVREDYLADFGNDTSLPELSASPLSCAMTFETSLAVYDPVLSHSPAWNIYDGAQVMSMVVFLLFILGLFVYPLAYSYSRGLENTALKAQLRAAIQRNNDAEAEKNRPNEEVAILLVTVETLRTEAQAQAEEKVKLNQEISALKSEKSELESIGNRRQDEISSLEGEVKTLRLKIEATTKSTPKLQQKDNEAKELKKEVERLRKENRTMSANAGRYETEKTTLSRDYEQANAEQEKLGLQVKTLEQQLWNKEKEVQKLQTSNKDAVDANERFEEKIAALESEKHQLNKNMASKTGELERLKAKIAAGEDEKARLEEQIALKDKESKHGDKVQLQVDLHLTKDALNKATLAHSSAEKEKKQIAAQNADLEEKCKAATEDLHQVQADNDELSTKVSTLTEELETTKTSLAEAKVVIDRMENEKGQKGIDGQSVPQELISVGESIIAGQADLHTGEHQSHTSLSAVSTPIDTESCSSVDGVGESPEAREDTDVFGKAYDGMSDDLVSTAEDTQDDKVTSAEAGSITEVDDTFPAGPSDNKDNEEYLAQEQCSETAMDDNLFRVDADMDSDVEDEGSGEEVERKQLEQAIGAEAGINAAFAQQSEADMLFADHAVSDVNELVQKAAPVVNLGFWSDKKSESGNRTMEDIEKDKRKMVTAHELAPLPEVTSSLLQQDQIDSLGNYHTYIGRYIAVGCPPPTPDDYDDRPLRLMPSTMVRKLRKKVHAMRQDESVSQDEVDAQELNAFFIMKRTFLSHSPDYFLPMTRDITGTVNKNGGLRSSALVGSAGEPDPAGEGEGAL